ncbi:inhibitor of nuclear factor kappa-B kinase-interacting protein [Megalops cyprinoides]|uniref:inhibitor of nuclear factor kappa-B kinase-interacting protein n=1 Tax=Megalops cyprinoides TaxID=118141 RepID=UPI001863DAFA|nr:inhibitor of nuclear factor kappa-B kinase-interacting protein [Megalops cyprinoides]
MPSNDLKQRKKTTTQVKDDEKTDDTSKPKGEEEEAKKVDVTERKRSALDVRTLACLLSVVLCLVLSWIVLQQNARFADVEEKYKLLYRKTVMIKDLEDEIGEVSRKLDSSETDLQGAISSMSLVTKLEEDVSGLRAVITATQEGERSASFDIQRVNQRFLNVTEAWQGGLEAATRDIGGLRVESRAAHGRVTEKVNEAEGLLRALAERLEELEESTRRNARALERTEEDDAGRVREQLDWNTRQIHRLEERQVALSRRGAELADKLAEHVPRGERCQEQLPAVEDAVRSILRLTAELGAAQRRVEELTLQVFGVEDSALRAVTEILDIRRALDALQADNSILKMRNDLGVVKETVMDLYRARRELEDLELLSRQGELEDLEILSRQVALEDLESPSRQRAMDDLEPPSRQGELEDPEPPSKQGELEDPEPLSRQGELEDLEPPSRQGAPEDLEPPSRQGAPEDLEPPIRQEVPEDLEPPTRQGEPEDLEPPTGQEVPEEGKHGEHPEYNGPVELGDFENIQTLLERVEGRAVLSHVRALQQDVSQLKEWASGLGEKRAKMEESLSALSEAVRAIEQRTGAVTSDMGAKVAAVRTDVRRMAGLEAEVEALLEQERELEMKVALAEKATARRIGDLLAGSIDRVSALRSGAERDAESLERLRRRLAELAATDKELADRLLALEGGRARMLKTLTFASDLKPKVSTIRKDFALLDPLVSDLTLRIGRLAEDMMRREEEIAQLRETFANLTAVQGDLRDVQQQLTQVPGVGEMFPRTNPPGE